MRSTLGSAALILVVTLPCAQPCDPGSDQAWDGRFYSAGHQGTGLWASTLDDQGRLLVAGFFHLWGGQPINHLARWDGTAWEGIGDPLNVAASPNGSTYLRAVSARGDEIVVGGNGLQAAGELPVRNIAHWDGSSWSDLGGGIDGSVHAICQDGSRIYAGGRFTEVGGVAATNVACWDGVGWTPLGAGLTGATISSVDALTVHEGHLYAGGTFTHSGSALVPGIARWTGVDWVPVGDAVLPQPGRPSIQVKALLSDAAGLYAGGQFEELAGVPLAGVGRWDGTAWQALGAGVSGRMRPAVWALAPWAGGVAVGGFFEAAGGLETWGLALWNAESWSVWEDLPLRSARSLAAGHGRLAAVGTTTDVVAGVNSGVAVWEPSQWQVLGQGFSADAKVQTLGVTPAGVVAGGYFAAPSDTHYRSVARFDGERWHPLGEGLKTPKGVWPQTVSAVVPLGNSVVAGGNFLSVSDVAATHIAIWDGASWSAVGGGLPEPVAAMAVSGARLYAGCESGVAVWDGGQWASLGWDSPGPVSALVADGDLVYAVQRPLGIASTASVHRWDGLQWNVLSPEIQGQLWAMALTADGLHVGGRFTNIGEVTADGVARWREGTWSTVGAGLAIADAPGQVLGLTADPLGRLYAVGEFNASGNSTLRNVARYADGTWCGLGSGLNLAPQGPATQGMAWWRDSLYVAGAMFEAGGKESLRFAAWHDPSAAFWIELNGLSSVPPGQTTELSLSVFNLRPQDATGAQVTLELPPGIVAVSGSDGAVLEASSIHWELGVLEPGARNLSAVVTVPSQPGAVVFRNLTVTAEDVNEARAPWFTLTVEPPVAPPVVRLAAPTPRSEWDAAAGLVLAAEGSDAVSGVAAVEFYAGAQLLGTVLAAPYEFFWAEPPPGDHRLRALARSTDGRSAVSLPVPVKVLVRPANDNFAHRIPVTAQHALLAGTTLNATLEPWEPFGDQSTIWWEWRPPFAGVARVWTGAKTNDTRLRVFAGDDEASLIQIGVSDRWQDLWLPDGVAFVAEAGLPYAIGVGSTSFYGSGPVTVGLLLEPLPANDDFAHRQSLAGFELAVEGDTVGATVEPGEPMHGGIQGEHSLWYTWTAPAAGRVVIRTDSGEVMGYLGVYTGTNLEGLSVIPNTDPDTGEPHSTATGFLVAQGTTLQLAIDATYPAGRTRLTLALLPSGGLLDWHPGADGQPPGLRLLAESEVEYTLEWSDDLRWWTPHSIHRGTGAWLVLPNGFRSEGATRFYRVRRD
jgi:trimeric autotransporter adhesin